MKIKRSVMVWEASSRSFMASVANTVRIMYSPGEILIKNSAQLSALFGSVLDGVWPTLSLTPEVTSGF